MSWSVQNTNSFRRLRPVTLILVLLWALAGCAAPGASHSNGEGPTVPTSELTATLAPTVTSVLTWTPVPEPTATSPTSTPFPSPSPTPAPSPTAALEAADLPLAEVAYRLPLTLRHVTRTAATLFFEFNVPSPGLLILQPTTRIGPGVERALASDQVRHLVTIENLTPGTEYETFVVLGDSRNTFSRPNFQSRAWGPLRFSTPADRDPLRFGVIGDASFGDPATVSLITAMAAADLDFVLHLGDVVDETGPVSDPYDSYARKFFGPFEPLLTRMPIYTVPGNHDYDPDIRWNGSPFYDTVFPPFPDPLFPGQGEQTRNQFYAAEYRGFQFVFLDTQTFFGVPGREAQLAWLIERLEDPDFGATIPVFHVSPLSSSSVHPNDGRPVRSTWSPLFEAAQVPVVFSGHFHQYERLQAGGITYLVSGGGSSILYAPGPLIPESLVFHRRTHFVLGVLEDGVLGLTAIGLEGELLDQVEIGINLD